MRRIRRTRTKDTTGAATTPATTNRRTASMQKKKMPALPPQWWKARKAKRRGEWWELTLPDEWAHVPTPVFLRTLPMSTKLGRRLHETDGIVRTAQTLRLKLFPHETCDFTPQFKELQVLYEDDFILVINKPAGMEVHPSVAGQGDTLAHAIAAYYAYTDQACRVRHIHRLDKDTTGPLLYAKNEYAHYVCDEAMRTKRIQRLYTAIVEGVPKKNKGEINAPIGQDRHHATRRRVSPTGESAVTWFTVIERFVDHAHVRLQLHTGRTHQIRVHMAHIGHPIAGDGMYGGHRQHIAHQALHGERLLLPHPWTDAPLDIHAPMPAVFARVLHKLRKPPHSQ